ncbi:MAG: hypothetical protein IPI30_22690 [Saprospiraceae bacterium]|nr:hypothetical protein [Candidatus Vicinibacter affinis]
MGLYYSQFDGNKNYLMRLRNPDSARHRRLGISKAGRLTLNPEGHCAGQSLTAMWYYHA